MMTKFKNSWGIHMREGLAEDSLSQLDGGWRGRSGWVYKAGSWREVEIPHTLHEFFILQRKLSKVNCAFYREPI